MRRVDIKPFLSALGIAVVLNIAFALCLRLLFHESEGKTSSVYFELSSQNMREYEYNVIALAPREEPQRYNTSVRGGKKPVSPSSSKEEGLSETAAGHSSTQDNVSIDTARTYLSNPSMYLSFASSKVDSLLAVLANNPQLKETVLQNMILSHSNGTDSLKWLRESIASILRRESAPENFPKTPLSFAYGVPVLSFMQRDNSINLIAVAAAVIELLRKK